MQAKRSEPPAAAPLTSSASPAPLPSSACSASSSSPSAMPSAPPTSAAISTTSPATSPRSAPFSSPNFCFRSKSPLSLSWSPSLEPLCSRERSSSHVRTGSYRRLSYPCRRPLLHRCRGFPYQAQPHQHLHVDRADAQRRQPYLRRLRAYVASGLRPDLRLLRDGRRRSRGCGRPCHHHCHLPQP